MSYSSPVVSLTLYLGGGRAERLAWELSTEGITRFSLLTFKPKEILNRADVETHFDNFHRVLFRFKFGSWQRKTVSFSDYIDVKVREL